MLALLKKNFELILFTAGVRNYAQKIVAVIEEEERYFDHIISRDYCSLSPGSRFHVKDLMQLLENRSIKDIVIVDNKATSFAIHFTNGIPIKDYEGDKTDRELVALTAYLQSFQGEPDVR